MLKSTILIDGGYLDCLPHKYRVDFKKLSNELTNNETLVRTYYYHCLPYQSNPAKSEENRKFSQAQKFYSALKKLPNFEVRLGRLAYRGIDENGKIITVQKGVDIHLAVDLIRLSSQKSIDKAYIITNDSDFIPAIQYCKNIGIQIILVHIDKPQRHLEETVDNCVLLDHNFLSKIQR